MLVLSLFNPRFFRPNWHPPAPPAWRDSQSARRGWRRGTDMDGRKNPDGPSIAGVLVLMLPSGKLT